MLRLRPKRICLIDGEFRQALAVQHKEIVFALLQGVLCIGAASMGALRAAELHRYGMIGIGRIFAMYRDGEEDDSLVAMTYDSVSYKPLEQPRIGQETKVADALEAISFARNFRGKPNTELLNAQAISPFFEMVIMRALEQ